MSDEIRVQSEYWSNEADSFERIYSKKKSSFSGFLDQTFRKDMFDRFTFTMDQSEPIAGRSFLDVGCGSGVYSVRLAQKGARKVVGLDIAEKMLVLCRTAAHEAGVDGGCEWVKSDLLGFAPREKYDVSIGIGLFDYISDPLPVLKKMKEVTSDKAILSFPRLWTWRAPIRKARLALRGCPVYFYSGRKVSSLLDNAGFGRHTIRRVGKLHCVVAYVR